MQFASEQKERKIKSRKMKSTGKGERRGAGLVLMLLGAHWYACVSAGIGNIFTNYHHHYRLHYIFTTPGD